MQLTSFIFTESLLCLRRRELGVLSPLLVIFYCSLLQELKIKAKVSSHGIIVQPHCSFGSFSFCELNQKSILLWLLNIVKYILNPQVSIMNKFSEYSSLAIVEYICVCVRVCVCLCIHSVFSVAWIFTSVACFLS